MLRKSLAVLAFPIILADAGPRCGGGGPRPEPTRPEDTSLRAYPSPINGHQTAKRMAIATKPIACNESPVTDASRGV